MFSNCSLLHTFSIWMTPDLHHWVSTMTARGATAINLEGLSQPAPQAAGCASPGTIRLHEGRIGPCESALTRFKSGMFAYNDPSRLGVMAWDRSFAASKRLCQASCGAAEAQPHLELCWKTKGPGSVSLVSTGSRQAPGIVPKSALHSWSPKVQGMRERRTNVT